MSHKSNNVPGKPESIKDSQNNFYTSPQFIISCILCVVGIIFSYYLGLNNGRNEEAVDCSDYIESSDEIYEETVNYSYYEKFKQFLYNGSDAYNTSSDEFLKEEYESWMNNTGYADIIIGIDGELESVSANEEFEVKDISDINYAIYTFSDDFHNSTIIIKTGTDVDEIPGVISLSYSNSEQTTIVSSELYINDIENNTYKIARSADMYITFTDYGTAIITNGFQTSGADEVIDIDLFVGEYIPVHLY